MEKGRLFTMFLAIAALICRPCQATVQEDTTLKTKTYTIDKEGKTLGTRFVEKDKRWERPFQKEDYAQWLLNLEVFPDEHETTYFDKITKDKESKIYLAVLKFDLIGDFDRNGIERPANLQQCADACMRIRAEYLWQNKKYGEIHFKTTAGFEYNYTKWAEGYRIHYDSKGQETWVKSATEDFTYITFRKFLSLAFKNCGTLSLSKELRPIMPSEVRPGDLLIFGGSPGHAVTVMDVQRNKETGETRIMLSQSYMPAQEIEILANWEDEFSPWFEISDNKEQIQTPQWNFKLQKGSKFMRWVEE